ncbi:hypothetical protein MCEHALHM7_00829 [Methylophilaceae bacterium]
MKIKYDDWLKILQQTVQESNWSHLHSQLKSENTKFLILKNYIDEIQDAILSGYKNVENSDWLLIKQSFQQSMNVFKEFREGIALDYFLKNMPNNKDINIVLGMFTREAKLNIFKENPNQANWAVFELISDVIKRISNHPNIDDMRVKQALYEPRVGRPDDNPIESPLFINRFVKTIIENDITFNKVMENEINNFNTPNHDSRTYRKKFEVYKWAALNEYLYERAMNKKAMLSTEEIDRVRNYWNGIQLPEKLEIYASFITYGIGKLEVKDIQIIKSNSTLH